MVEGWLINSNDNWIWRFHRDNSAWVRDPKVFIDRGRQMPDGPPLLKEHRYLRKDAAEQLWRSLQTQGWRKRNPYGGGFRRTLKPFRSKIVSVLIRRGGVVLGLSDWSQVVSSCRIWMAI